MEKQRSIGPPANFYQEYEQVQPFQETTKTQAPTSTKH